MIYLHGDWVPAAIIFLVAGWVVVTVIKRS